MLVQSILERLTLQNGVVFVFAALGLLVWSLLFLLSLESTEQVN